MTQPDPEPFGFTVKPEQTWDAELDELVPTGNDFWRVHLPLQCDAWDIAGDGYEGVPHADAVAALERFVTEAQDALAALRERREIEEH